MFHFQNKTLNRPPEEVSDRPDHDYATPNQPAIFGIEPSMPTIAQQIIWLFVLSIPVACVAWTITHEEVFREPREYCQRQSQDCRSLPARKFFYVFTCEYCLSHYVAAVFLIITRYKLLYPDWRGYLLSLFALVWMANIYMNVYNRLRLDIKHEHIAIKAEEEQVENQKAA